MRITKYLFLPIVAVLVVGCTDEAANPSPPTTQQVLMPLAVGNEWVYAHSRYLEGKLDSTLIWPIHIHRVKTDSLGRKCYSPLEKDTTIGNSMFSMWWTNTERGLEYFGEPIGLFIWRYPVPSGFSYPLDTKLMYYNMVVSCIDTLITVPAGTFSCYRYDYHNDKHEYFASDYYSPGVGRIYAYIMSFDSVMTMKDELIEYHLK
jgi:hypothetical protein